jgi:DNA-binding CsgD family transcriptional regulator
MQGQQTGETYQVSAPGTTAGGGEGLRSRLLLVGSEGAFEGDTARRVLGGDQFYAAGRATTLLEGLSRLESDAIDVVLVSVEFREEELSLFAYDAHRRGFRGLILHVASLPPDWEDRFGRQRATGRHGLMIASGGAGLSACLAAASASAVWVDGPTFRVSLTAKERAVLAGVSEGWSNLQIARSLNCSEGSVKAILQQLFGKLGVRRRAQVVRLALEMTLVEPRWVSGGAAARAGMQGGAGQVASGIAAAPVRPEKSAAIEMGDRAAVVEPPGADTSS